MSDSCHDCDFSHRLALERGLEISKLNQELTTLRERVRELEDEVKRGMAWADRVEKLRLETANSLTRSIENANEQEVTIVLLRLTVDQLKARIRDLEEWRENETAARCRLVDAIEELAKHFGISVPGRVRKEMRGGYPGEACRISPVCVAQFEEDYCLNVFSAIRDRVRELEHNSHWEASARDFAKAADYYRGLVVECGKAIGKAAFTADDGGVHEDVLCAKVPELVLAMASRVTELEAALPLPCVLRSWASDVDAPAFYSAANGIGKPLRDLADRIEKVKVVK